MPVYLALFISLGVPINRMTVLSLVAIAGGLYFLFVGFHLLARKRLLLTTPTSRIRNAPLGPVEVNGFAAGPNTVTAPISGKPCFLYRTTAWLNRENNEWEQVAEETLHVPFFIVNATVDEKGKEVEKERDDDQLLIEPLGADLDLQPDLREEYSSLFVASGSDELPPRVIAFLSRHRIVPSRRLRIEERSIKLDDSLFIAGTRMENPGVVVRSPASQSESNESDDSKGKYLSGKKIIPEIIRLAAGASATSTRDMSQQAKIAAALNRAGINRPEAWSAAGVSRQSVAVAEHAQPENDTFRSHVAAEDKPKSSGFDTTGSDTIPPFVMMKASVEATFVISYRSQKAIVAPLAWKSSSMIGGGVAIMLLGAYVLLDQMKLL